MKWLVVCLPLLGCSQQSCEGGRWVQEGWHTVWHKIGDALYPLQHPHYVCKKERDIKGHFGVEE